MKPSFKKAIFSGRENELEDVRYYLNQAENAPRPINLALLGDRAAGKTSLLNMIELEAKERNLCVSRIDLNEGDVESQLSFFFKIFSSVFSAACKFENATVSGEKRFGFLGVMGKTYQTYLDIVSTYSVPQESEWTPFLFPTQYARAMSSNNFNARVFDETFKDDLSLIKAETQRPIVILFDECTVLSNKRVLLQMVRNIFTRLDGYLLVFTGTPDLFPIMDEVFSPIIRGFKKIDVGPFSTKEETKNCVFNPLKSIGVSNIEDVFDFDAHYHLFNTFANGRPYEIQLLCHFMFKRAQNGQTEKMSLNLAVFDDVVTELQKGRDIFAHPIIDIIRSLSEEQLDDLALLSRFDNELSFQEIVFSEKVFLQRPETVLKRLEKNLELFISLGIIGLSNNKIKFLGR